MAVRLTGSILIHGAYYKQRHKKATEILAGVSLEISENNPDVLIVEPLKEKKSIGIDQIREVIKFLSEKPFSNKYKAVLISKAEKLTIPAQNALLKTLEEPPSYGVIILLAKTEASVLETIQSRCRKIPCRGSRSAAPAQEVGLEQLQDLTIGQRLTWALEFSKTDREKVIEMLEIWVVDIRTDHPSTQAHNSPQKYKAIEKVMMTAKDLENTNINQKLALENLVVNL